MHEMMGYPLKENAMLALILYDGIGCRLSFAQSQKDGTCVNKWPIFDECLENAIQTFSKFQELRVNIYCGLCDIFLDVNKLSEKRLNDCASIYFNSTMEFSTDISIAQEFRGPEGMMIQLNLSDMRLDNGIDHDHKQIQLHACDVSWFQNFQKFASICPNLIVKIIINMLQQFSSMTKLSFNLSIKQKTTSVWHMIRMVIVRLRNALSFKLKQIDFFFMVSIIYEK